MNTTLLFLLFVTVTAAVMIAMAARRGAWAFVIGLLLWLGYVGAIGYFGVIRNATMRPPGMVFLFVPVVALLVIFLVHSKSAAGAKLSASFPLWLLIGAQGFRIVVELFIHRLWIEGLVPKMLTFSGANVDLYVGISAPIVAWISTRGNGGKTFALIWNGVGILALANVVVRAVLTTPGPLHLIDTEIPNAMIGTFPFMFIPGLFVPLALVLHVLAIRNIRLTDSPR